MNIERLYVYIVYYLFIDIMCPFISFEYVVAECSDLHASSSRQEEAKQADSEDAKELRAEPCIFACQALRGQS